MKLISGYISEARVKCCLASIVDSDFLSVEYPALTQVAREALTYIIRLERKVDFYEEKAKKFKRTL